MRLSCPILVTLTGRFVALVLWLLFCSLRLEVRVAAASPYRAVGDKKFFFSVWHDSAVIAAFGGRHSRTIALTSRHRDGAFVASIVRAIGLGVVRGSTGKTGSAAARALIVAAQDHDIVITPDGPRGPRRQVSSGIVYLASRTGNAIIPTAFACERCWEFRGSWTNLTIPTLFSRVVLLAGEPLSVPGILADSELETYRKMLQDRMDALQLAAETVHQDLRLDRTQPVPT